MRLLETFAAAVPHGKGLVWLLGGFATMFAAGFGAAFGVGDTAERLDQIPGIAETVASNVNRINMMDRRLADIDTALADARNADRRILCLAGLTATGEVVLPTNIDERCP